MSPFVQALHRRSETRCNRTFLPIVSSIATILLCSAGCNGFLSHVDHSGSLATIHHSGSYSKPVTLRTNTRLFIQRESSDSSSTTQDESLFFAQDMMDTSYATFDELNAIESESQGNLNDNFFYAQQSTQSQNDDGGGAYDATFSAFRPMETENTGYESWSTESGAPIEQADDTSTAPNSESQPISSVDARVLESILQEGKLDLTTEERVKKLLEGPRVVEDGAVDSTVSGEYNSKFVRKISDNTFWNSIKAKAGEVLESVQIYIENRIERDTQTLAAVGIFTFDRIRRDVGRALPAAGRQVKKLLLASNSTYAEKLVEATEKTVMALPSERSKTDREMDSYEELTTAADEIKQVTEAIRDILAGKELSASSSSRRRGVRSLAPAGTSRMAERQQRAYLARKKTVLQREQEGIDKTIGRAIGSVSDATWELRQEMNSGVGREAGYRSKGVRKALAGGAVRLLEAGRESSRRLLSGGTENKMIENDINDARGTYAKSANVGFVDVDAGATEEEGIIDEVIEETILEYAPDGLLSPQSFIEEKQRLITSLELCLSQPGETWLTKKIVSEATEIGIGLDGEVLRQVITSMIALRDELKEELVKEEEEDCVYLKIDYVQNELRRMKDMVDVVTNLAASAAGEGAAILLKTELEGFVLSESLDEIIEIELNRLEQLLAEMVATREQEINSRRQVYQNVEYPRSVVEVVEQDPMEGRQSTQINSKMYTEVEVEPRSFDQGTYVPDNGEDTVFDDQDSYQFSSSSVEVISDQEYFEYEQQFKTVQTGDLIDDEEGVIQDDNPAVKFVLRVVDAIFFVGEKFFLVGLPSVFLTTSNAAFRYSQAQNRGSGSDGWQILKNLQRKKNQY